MTEEEKTTEVFARILARTPKWKKIWWRFQWDCGDMWYNLHSDEYRKDVWLNKHLFLFWLFGYKVLEMGTYFGEDIFVFETKEEAHKAFEFFERGSPVPETGIEEDDDLPKYRGWMCGWFYSKSDLLAQLKEEHEKDEKDGNIIEGNGSALGNTCFRGVSFNYIKLWERKNEK